MTNDVAIELDQTDSHTHANDDTDCISAAVGHTAASLTADTETQLLSEQQPTDIKISGSPASQDQLQGYIL